MPEKNTSSQSPEHKAKTLIDLLEDLPLSFLFRGEGKLHDKKEEEKVTSSLYRKVQDSDQLLRRDRNTLAYHRQEYPGGEVVFDPKILDTDILAYLRHFDQAVNVIDFSESPQVALYFACATKEEKSDGRLILLNRKWEKMKRIKKEDYPDNLPELGYVVPHGIKESRNRVQYQKSVLILPKKGYIDGVMSHPDSSLERKTNEGAPLTAFHITIKKGMKKAIREELKKNGIDDDYIYSDPIGRIRYLNETITAETSYTGGNKFLDEEERSKKDGRIT